jgi:transcriptional regulator with XRE-family HTH domain
MNNDKGVMLMSVTKSSAQKETQFESFVEDRVSAYVTGNVLHIHDKGRVAHNKLLTRKRKKSRHPLRDLRLQRGYTLEELAELTKLSPSYLSRLESGSRRLNADILQRIALVLSCHPGDLLPHDAHTSKYIPQSSWTKEASLGVSQDLPLYKLERRQDGTLTLDVTSTREWVNRPPEMTGVANAFAFSIADNDINPRYGKSDRIFAHPARSLTPECYMLAVNAHDQAFVGQFMGWHSDAAGQPDALELSVLEFSQNAYKEKKISIPRNELKASFRIVGTMEAA